MTYIPPITDAEWRIMQALWARTPQTAQDLVATLADERDWSPSTVKTLLARLVTKQAVGFTRQGREHHYHPLLSETACRRDQSRSFLQRVFGGALEPMVATLLDDGPVDPGELDALRRLLDEKARAVRTRR